MKTILTTIILLTVSSTVNAHERKYQCITKVFGIQSVRTIKLDQETIFQTPQNGALTYRVTRSTTIGQPLSTEFATVYCNKTNQGYNEVRLRLIK